MLDGSTVNIGDSVYVLGVGGGTVTSVNADGGFTVRTGNGEAYYRNGGYIGNQKRVFWADPYIVLPTKDRRFWRAYVQMASSLYSQAREFYRYGEAEESSDVEGS